MKLKSLIEPGDPERIAAGFTFTEGPVWHPDGLSVVLRYSGQSHPQVGAGRRRDRLARAERQLERSDVGPGRPADRLRARQSARVASAAPDGSVTVLADRYQGKRLNSPNDVVVKSDGTIYFTDPPYGIDLKDREQQCNGVYRILPGGAVELLADDFDRPNGLAFSPDETVLYIDDSPRRHVRAFDVRLDGTLSNSRVIADMDHPQPGSPDGMKIDSRRASVRDWRNRRVGV